MFVLNFMEQKRLLLALVLSAVILIGWSYLFPPPPPTKNNANNANAQQQSAQTPAPETPAPTEAATNAQTDPSTTVVDDAPQRTLTISTPLYETRLDSRGAVATSWIIKTYRDPETKRERKLYSIASTKEREQQLQLIPQEANLPESLRGKPRTQPLQLSAGEAVLDVPLGSRNYRTGDIAGEGDAVLELKPGEERRVELKMTDPASGLDVTKALTFKADSYNVVLETRVTRNGQPLPNVKMAVGPNIGDQGTPHYTFYQVAPEAVAVGGEKTMRLTASEIAGNKENAEVNGEKVQRIGGQVDWASVGDTYFAMALVLPRPIEGLEYRTQKYEHVSDGNKEERHLITAHVPVPTDGAPTPLFVGPKDHYLLNSISEELSAAHGGRPVDLEELINYGWFSSISRPLARPILWSIKHLNQLTGSYGVAIILFTIIIYTLFFPLKWRSSKSMKKAQKLAPRMKELQEKIKGMKQNDPRLKELQMEQLRLMKEGNPLGGCLPLLIQMPFLFALYSAITISIDFRAASFLWMPDLSASDPIHLLPFLMAGSMVVLQLITPAPSADPLQRKMMAVVLPLMMLYMLWSAPSGLLVYWLVGNIVGFSQQLLINRLVKSEDDEEPPEKNRAETRPRKSGPTKKLSAARASQT
ncbi:MAG TPA: membrane protein insertase YidC [Pyrinomonadaceae bacterium]|nr:membrane protein insertase YidC [Pyrinomonadaceae bacterium]